MNMYEIKIEHQANIFDSTYRKFLFALALVGFSSTNVVAADDTNFVEPTDWNQLVTLCCTPVRYRLGQNSKQHR